MLEKRANFGKKKHARVGVFTKMDLPTGWAFAFG